MAVLDFSALLKMVRGTQTAISNLEKSAVPTAIETVPTDNSNLVKEIEDIKKRLIVLETKKESENKELEESGKKESENKETASKSIIKRKKSQL